MIQKIGIKINLTGIISRRLTFSKIEVEVIKKAGWNLPLYQVTIAGTKLMIRQSLKKLLADIYKNTKIKFNYNKRKNELNVKLMPIGGYTISIDELNRLNKFVSQFTIDNGIIYNYKKDYAGQVSYTAKSIVVEVSGSQSTPTPSSTPSSTPTPTTTPTPTPTPPAATTTPTAFILESEVLRRCYGDNWYDEVDWDADMNNLFGRGLESSEVNDLKMNGETTIMDASGDTWVLKIEATTLLLYEKYKGYSPYDFKQLLTGLSVLSQFYNDVEAAREQYKILTYIQANQINIA